MKLFGKKEKEKIKEEKAREVEEQKFDNLGKYVNVPLSTGGRFAVKKDVVYFKPYDFEDISDFKSSRPEDIFETLITILNKNKSESMDFDAADLKLEEAVDIERALYGTAYSHVISYPVFCDEEECESNEGNEPKAYYHKLNLEDLNIVSIENLEDSWKESYKEVFEKDPVVFKEYVQKKYGDEEKTVQEVLDDIIIKEPFEIQMLDGKMMKIRFISLGDFATALRKGYSEFSFQLRKISNKKYANLDPADAKIQKKIDLENTQIQMMKRVNEYANAFAIVEFDSKVFKDIDEKLEFLRGMDPKYDKMLKEVSASLRFGVDHEFESICPVCGEKKIQSLESSDLISDLLPTSSSKLIEHRDDDTATGEQRGFSGIKVYF